MLFRQNAGGVGGGAKERPHGGLSLMRRPATVAGQRAMRDKGTGVYWLSTPSCLSGWRRAMYTHAQKAARDQPPLWLAERDGWCHVGTLSHELLVFPTKKSIAAGQYGVFNHFTRGGRLRMKGGMTNAGNMSRRDLELAGQALFNLSEQQAHRWWSHDSPFCPHATISQQQTSVSLVVSHAECQFVQRLTQDSALRGTALVANTRLGRWYGSLVLVLCCVSAVYAHVGRRRT
mmetsp:Transcript_6682/g.17479  ORF Transcript_6682/g.17479 Transcript_6682/m.17479 type:complete len:232 (-) Transcript_6682:113-808(-)|eukprot:5269005-Prymnesium_polylepis.1